METGDRVNVLIGRKNGPDYERGTIIDTHHYGDFVRFDVKCNNGTTLHNCRPESLRLIVDAVSK